MFFLPFCSLLESKLDMAESRDRQLEEMGLLPKEDLAAVEWELIL